MTPTPRPVTRIAVLLAAGALTVAACGKSTSTSTAGTSSTTAAASGTPTGSATSSMAKAKVDAKLGSILADSKGLTVYTLTKGGTAVACTGTCLTYWPPVHATGTAVGTVPGVVLSVVTGAGGTQLAAGGMPLYTFFKDKDSGDAYGEGVASFGGTWHVVKLGASPTTPTTAAPTTVSSGGGGY